MTKTAMTAEIIRIELLYNPYAQENPVAWKEGREKWGRTSLKAVVEEWYNKMVAIEKTL